MPQPPVRHIQAELCLLLLSLQQTWPRRHSSNRLDQDLKEQPLKIMQNTLKLKVKSHRSDKLCSDGYMKTVKMCIIKSSSDDFGNLLKHERAMVFSFNEHAVNIFFGVHPIMLPNASLTYARRAIRHMPLYREEISGELNSFYTGNLVFSNHSLAFTAEMDNSLFRGTSFYFNIMFLINCDSIFPADFLKSNYCHQCSASCIKVGAGIDASTINDFTDLLPELDNLMAMNHPPVPLHGVNGLGSVEEKHSRRWRRTKTILPKPVSCSLHVVADHLFFKYIGNGNVVETVNAMFRAVSEVDALFRSTDFDGDGVGDNIGFIGGKVTVYQGDSPGYMLSKPYMTSDEYLKQFSFYNFDDFCLGVGFTFRDFSGIAGTAFPGFSSPKTPGGICQKRIKINSHYVSFNTAIMSYLMSGRTSGQYQATLTLAHELGHSLGARHDGLECFPGGKYGNFIMSSKANNGDKPNHRRFSRCSIRSMLPVIKKKGICFQTSPLVPSCGNSVPERGEECDCGLSNICDFIDPCCTPADDKSGSDKPCTARRSKGKMCSPKTSTCCSSQCLYMHKNIKQACNPFDECSHKAFCTGESKECPNSALLPNGTMCNHNQQMCDQGRCEIDICRFYNTDTCLCPDRENQCRFCCWDPTALKCLPVSNFSSGNGDGFLLYLDTGAPCFGGQYCDDHHNCIKAITTAIPSHVLFGFKSPYQFQIYLKNYWLYFVFITLSVTYACSVVAQSYKRDDPLYLKALRYGKMLAIFAMGEEQFDLYKKKVLDINRFYGETVHVYTPMEYAEAIGRLKAFFPDASLRHLSRIAKISAAEHVAVRILLLQGYRFRTFLNK